MDGRTAAAPSLPGITPRPWGGGAGGGQPGCAPGARMRHGERCCWEPWVGRDGGGAHWGSWGSRGCLRAGCRLALAVGFRVMERWWWRWSGIAAIRPSRARPRSGVAPGGGGAGTPGRWHRESAAVTASSETRQGHRAPGRPTARGWGAGAAALRGRGAWQPGDPRTGPSPPVGCGTGAAGTACSPAGRGRCGARCAVRGYAVVPGACGASVWGWQRRGAGGDARTSLGSNAGNAELSVAVGAGQRPGAAVPGSACGGGELRAAVPVPFPSLSSVSLSHPIPAPIRVQPILIPLPFPISNPVPFLASFPLPIPVLIPFKFPIPIPTPVPFPT